MPKMPPAFEVVVSRKFIVSLQFTGRRDVKISSSRRGTTLLKHGRVHTDEDLFRFFKLKLYNSCSRRGMFF